MTYRKLRARAVAHWGLVTVISTLVPLGVVGGGGGATIDCPHIHRSACVCVRVLFENRHDYLRDARSNGISLSFGSPEIEHFKSQVNTVSFRFKYHNKRNRTKGHTHAQTNARRTCVHVCCRPLVCPLCPTECARARPRTSAKRIGTRKSVYIYCDVVRVCVCVCMCARAE